MHTRTTVLGLLALLSAACGGVTYGSTPLNASPRPLTVRPAGEVHVFTSGRPAHAYHEILLLQAEESNTYSNADEDELVRGLRERAGKAGCDGIILHEPTNTVATRVLDKNTRSLRGLRATCIVYDAPGATAETAPATTSR